MNQDFKKHAIYLTKREIELLVRSLIITKVRLGGMSFPIPSDIREKLDGNDVENLWFRLNRKLKEKE